MKFLKIAAKTPIIGRILLFGFRFFIGVKYSRKPISNFARWLVKSKETTNFNYDLEPGNKQYLAWLVADVASIDFALALKYINEIESDNALQAHISNTIESSEWAFMADRDFHLGRRIGWYALARATKPETIVETGVDKGLGSCVLAAALKRNTEEGYRGRYFGIDINPKAGYLLSGEYSKYGCILYGDSIQTLQKFDQMIHMFINDSDHSADYEAAEYEVITSKLAENSLVLGDNSHSTDKLFEFSVRTKRNFLFFPEKPLAHWYPGAGIGISFMRRQARQ